MANISRSEIRAELIRRELAIRRFSHFLRYRFLQERREIQWNWHLDLLCEVMEAVYKRDERRVLINMPFRFLKTETVEQAWQAWMILQEDSPRSSVLSAAADYTLAEESSAKTLDIVSSAWFQNLAGRPLLPAGKRPSRDDWTTVGGARRQAAGIGGQLTGKGADHLIWGDILKPEDANSDRKRSRACTWLGETFRSRLNNQKRGTITGIMQRLHEMDPAGYLLERMKSHGADKWLLIKIEMECPKRRVYAYGDFFYERRAGELLHPARVGPKEIAALKVDLGNNYEGQCNQNPIKMKGSYYQIDWFHFYDDEPPTLSHVYQVWDYALTEEHEESGDYSVCITFGLTRSGQLYILDVYRARIGSVDVVEQTMARAIQAKAIAVYGAKGPIDKAVRPWLEKRMQETGVYFRLEGIAETTDIVARSTPFQSMCRNGNVYLPRTARWMADWKLEFSAFPKGAHDDQCAAAALIGLAMPDIRAGEVVKTKHHLITPEERAAIDRNLITGIAIRKAVGKVAIPDHNLATSEPVRFALERVRAGMLITRITSEDYHLAVRDALLRFVKTEAEAGHAKLAAMATGELGRLDRRFSAGRFAPTPAPGDGTKPGVSAAGVGSATSQSGAYDAD